MAITDEERVALNHFFRTLSSNLAHCYIPKMDLGDMLRSLQDTAGVVPDTLSPASGTQSVTGTLDASADVNSGSGIFLSKVAGPMLLKSSQIDGATHSGFDLQTINSLVTSGAALFRILNNNSIAVRINKDGGIFSTAGKFGQWDSFFSREGSWLALTNAAVDWFSSNGNVFRIQDNNGSSVYTKLQALNNRSLVLDASTYVNGYIGLQGGLRLTLGSKTANATLTFGDQVIKADASTASFTLTLPTTAPSGQTYTIKRVNSGANTVTLAANAGQTIDGATTKVLGSQYALITVVADGTNWLITNQMGTVT